MKFITFDMYKENAMEVSTNVGKIPIAEYADIKAYEYGFDGYEDVLRQGYHIVLP